MFSRLYCLAFLLLVASTGPPVSGDVLQKSRKCMVPNIRNGYYSSAGQRFVDYGAVVVLTCKPGFAPRKNYVFTCNNNGRWTPRIGRCQRLPVSSTTILPTLPRIVCRTEDIENAVLFDENGLGTEQGDVFQVGELLAVKCKSGFKNDHEGNIKCMSNGMWFPPIDDVHCREDRKECDELPIIENGRIAKGPSTVGSLRKVKCFTGFSLKHNHRKVVRCQKSGKWSWPGNCTFPVIIHDSDGKFFKNVHLQQRRLIESSWRGDKTTMSRLIKEYAGYLNLDWPAPEVFSCGRRFMERSTALHRAVVCTGDVEAVKILLEAGASVEASEKLAEATPMTMAASDEDNVEIIETLLEWGADVNSKDGRGYTALIWAAMKGNNQIIRTLLNNGADIEAKTSTGFTAMKWAAFLSNAETVSILREFGASTENCNYPLCLLLKESS